jgi:hypothetical protein
VTSSAGVSRNIDGISTAMGTDDKMPRPYRFGCGVLDTNLNGIVDPAEKRVFRDRRRPDELHVLRKSAPGFGWRTCGRHRLSILYMIGTVRSCD